MHQINQHKRCIANVETSGAAKQHSRVAAADGYPRGRHIHTLDFASIYWLLPWYLGCYPDILAVASKSCLLSQNLDYLPEPNTATQWVRVSLTVATCCCQRWFGASSFHLFNFFQVERKTSFRTVHHKTSDCKLFPSVLYSVWLDLMWIFLLFGYQCCHTVFPECEIHPFYFETAQSHLVFVFSLSV